MSKKETLRVDEVGHYYSLKSIQKTNSKYNISYGERSTGKTYAVLLSAFEDYIKTGRKLALIRRWDTDFQGPQSSRSCYDSLMCDGNKVNQIERLSHGKYSGVLFSGGKYWLCTIDDLGNLQKTDEYCAIAFALSRAEHYKGASFPTVGTIFFDEFIATGGKYLVNEYSYFVSVLSTIIRDRDDVVVYMCGNTIENPRTCIYMKELGLTNVKNQKPCTIDIYEFGDLRIACEYTGNGRANPRKSNVYFAFNKKNCMTTEGDWELPMVPRLPHKYRPKDIKFQFIIEYDAETVMGEILLLDKSLCIFFHPKTTEIRKPDKDRVYSNTQYSTLPNWKRNILGESDKVSLAIRRLMQANDKIYYSDNETAAIVQAYMRWCKADAMLGVK